MTYAQYTRLIEGCLTWQEAVTASGSCDTQYLAVAEYLWDRMHRPGHCCG